MNEPLAVATDDEQPKLANQIAHWTRISRPNAEQSMLLTDSVRRLLSDQLDAISGLLAEDLTLLLKRECELVLWEVGTPEQADTAGPPIPHLRCVQELTSGEDTWCVGMHVAQAQFIIDLMLGGHVASPSSEREPTELEFRLLERFNLAVGRRLGEACRVAPKGCQWQPGKPTVVSSAPSGNTGGNAVVPCRFELEFPGLKQEPTAGALPIEILLPARVAAQMVLRGNGSSSRPVAENDVELVIDLARSSISISDLENLQVGDLITTEQHTQTPLSGQIEGWGRVDVRPGALRGMKAVEFTGPIVETE